MKRLLLDDYRTPKDCSLYMHQRIGTDNFIYLEPDWIIVKHYSEFVNYITENGLPNLISFDHDLSDGHYHKNFQNGVINYDSEDFNKNYFKSGYHCARWLINYCQESGLKLPQFYVHSMNPIGTENILSILNNYLKHEQE